MNSQVHGNTRLRIATYNVHNLFTDAEAEAAGAKPKTPKALKALTGTIAALGADVLLLQEIGAGGLLNTLNERLPEPYPHCRVIPGNSTRGIHLAMMSRLPFQVTSHRDHPLTDEAGQPLCEYETESDASSDIKHQVLFQRDLLLTEVALEADAGPLALFNVHLKSKTNRPWRLQPADVIRLAECRAVADLVGDYLARHPERPVLLGGDFNDTSASAPLAPIFELPLTDPLGERLAREGRHPSSYWPKRRMRLDFLLTSDAARKCLVTGSEQIHDGQRARRASDHYPVSLDLDYTGLSYRE